MVIIVTPHKMLFGLIIKIIKHVILYSGSYWNGITIIFLSIMINVILTKVRSASDSKSNRKLKIKALQESNNTIKNEITKYVRKEKELENELNKMKILINKLQTDEECMKNRMSYKIKEYTSIIDELKSNIVEMNKKVSDTYNYTKMISLREKMEYKETGDNTQNIIFFINNIVNVCTESKRLLNKWGSIDENVNDNKKNELDVWINKIDKKIEKYYSGYTTMTELTKIHNNAMAKINLWNHEIMDCHDTDIITNTIKKFYTFVEKNINYISDNCANVKNEELINRCIQSNELIYDLTKTIIDKKEEKLTDGIFDRLKDIDRLFEKYEILNNKLEEMLQKTECNKVDIIEIIKECNANETCIKNNVNEICANNVCKCEECREHKNTCSIKDRCNVILKNIHNFKEKNNKIFEENKNKRSGHTMQKLNDVDMDYAYEPEYEIYFESYGYPKSLDDFLNVDMEIIESIKKELYQKN